MSVYHEKSLYLYWGFKSRERCSKLRKLFREMVSCRRSSRLEVYKLQSTCKQCKETGIIKKLLIIQLKRFRKVESSVEKIYKRVKFPMDKTVIGDKKYELKGVTYHSGSPMWGHYTAAVKFKKRWWNCNDAVVKTKEEGKIVSEDAFILFYMQMWGYLKTAMSDKTFG